MSETLETQSFRTSELHPNTDRASIEELQTTFADYMLFIDTLPGKLHLIEAVNRLTNATDFEALKHAAGHLFINTLRFDSEQRDVSHRFHQTTLKQVFQLASYDKFIITLVERNDRVPHPTSLRPVFNNYPYGLVITITPYGQTIRINFQQTASNNEPFFRTLAGQPLGREPGDNLLMWAKRFALFTPAYGNDAQTLRDKAHAAFAVSPQDIAQIWHSSTITRDEEALPGDPWESMPHREVREFFQAEIDLHRRPHWGLQAALRNRFPMQIAKGEAILHYDSYEIVDDDIFHVHRTPAPNETRAITCVLNLRSTLTKDGIITHDKLSVRCRIPIPDNLGIFTLDGVQYAFHPELDDAGEHFRELILDDEDLVDEFVAALNRNTEESPKDEIEPEESDDLPEDLKPISNHNAQNFTQTIAGYSGASIRGLLEYLTERMLGGIAVRLWRYPKQYISTHGDILSALYARTDNFDRINIVAEKALKSALTPVIKTDSNDMHLRVVHQQNISSNAHPPAWACLELSAALPPGHWYPVSAARLHPSGALAIPVSHKGDNILAVQTGSALDYNARSTSDVRQPSHWWIATALHDWAALPCGNLDAPDRVARRAHWLDFPAVIIPGENLCALIAPEVLAALPRRRWTLTCDIPQNHKDESLKPIPLVEPGQSVSAGDAWLKTPLSNWQGAKPAKLPPIVHAWCDILSRPTSKTQTQEFDLERIPPGITGKVLYIDTQPIKGDFNLTIGWRATVEIIAQAGHHADICLPDGRLVPVIGTLHQDKAPFTEDGIPTPILIKDPAFIIDLNSYQTWFDADTGELLLVHVPSNTFWVERDHVQAITPADPHLRFSLFDRTGLAANASAPAITESERRWLSAAYPNVSARLNQIEQTWNADAPAYWTRLLIALEAAGIDPPAIGPLEWQVPARERFEKLNSKFDPMRTSLNKIHSQYWHFTNKSEHKKEYSSQPDLQFTPHISWSCACHALTGEHRALERCESCDELVVQRRRLASDIKIPTIQLPERVLHPWYLNECATLLGLLPSEFENIIKTHGGPHVTQAVFDSLKTPFRNIELRISQCDDNKTKSELKRNYNQLKASIITLKSNILLNEIPLIAPVLRPTGLPWGAPDILVSPIIKNYQNLRLAIDLLTQISSHAPDWLKADAWIGLQDAITALFGDLNTPTPGFDTIAAITQRVLPTTRAPEHKHVVPGMFRAYKTIRPSDTQSSEDSFNWAVPFGEELIDSFSSKVRMQTQKHPVLGAITTKGIETLPTYQETRRPLETDFWKHRFYRKLILDRHLPTLAAILGRLDNNQHAAATISLSANLTLTPATIENLGAVLLREFVRALDQQAFSASSFYELLAGQSLLCLPSEHERAQEHFFEQLSFDFDFTPELSLLAAGLFYIFASWAREHSTKKWHWMPTNKSLPKTFCRSIPPLTSSAWDDWPDINFGREPLRWLRDNPERFPSTIRGLLLWNTDEIPELTEHLTGLPHFEVTPSPPHLTPLIESSNIKQPTLKPIQSKPAVKQSQTTEIDITIISNPDSTSNSPPEPATMKLLTISPLTWIKTNSLFITAASSNAFHQSHSTDNCILPTSPLAWLQNNHQFSLDKNNE